MSRYYKFSDYLKKKFSSPVYKITLDAGFNCPNRDGVKGTGGCIFCNNSAFSPANALRGQSIAQQIQEGIKKIQARKKVDRFIAYFQPYSNTYAAPEKLKSIYEQALDFPDIIGIAVGTRPDCLGDDILSVLEQMAGRTHFWLEIGLETIHNSTLQRINRGHTFEEFLESYKRARKIPGLLICVHLIHGLPGESREMMLETVQKINVLKPDAVKFHQLEIVKDTPLEKDYQSKKISLLTLDQYLEITGESLKKLHPEIIIQRLFGLTPSSYLVAPVVRRNIDFNQLMETYLETHQIFQGMDFKKTAEKL